MYEGDTLQAHSDVTPESHFYEYDMKSLLFPAGETGTMLCWSSCDNPKTENSAAYFLVLLHIMIKENTNFALFTLEVIHRKNETIGFSAKKLPVTSS